jgi:DNA-binding transcriptional LysR family regulator
MRLRHIEVFNAIMVSGTVSGAARLMNISQPAVSRLLQHAELQLGFALFHRAKGRLIPSDEAQSLFPRIEHLYGNLREVERLAQSLRAGESEASMRVLSILTLSHTVLPRAIKIFRGKHPKVRIEMLALHSPEIVNALALQEADVGFLFSHSNHPALVAEELAKAKLVCVAPKGMLKAKVLAAQSASLADLKGLKLISLDSDDPVGTAIRQACELASISFESDITVQTYHAALALVEHGFGAAILDSCTALSANLDKVIVLPLNPELQIPVKALRSVNKSGSVIVRSFVQAVQKVLQQAEA